MTTHWTLVKFFGVLSVLNAIFTVHRIASNNPTTVSSQTSNECCGCNLFQWSSRQLQPVQGPPPSFVKEDTLTRVGSELLLDYSSCPPSAAMVDPAKRNATPLHDDCPHVFVLGAARSGVTSLYTYLSRHPEFQGIRLGKGPYSGETNHFTALYNAESWNKYVSQFKYTYYPIKTVLGEKSLRMFAHCKAPQRLFDSCGRHAKVLLLLRNPTQRYWSVYRQKSAPEVLTRLFVDKSALKETLTDDSEMHKLLASSPICQFSELLVPNELYTGFYLLHLRNWLCNFPSENILILNSEEFHNNRVKVFNQILQFLNLRPMDTEQTQLITNFRFNYGRYIAPSSSTNRVYRVISDTYSEHNRQLCELLQWTGRVNWTHSN